MPALSIEARLTAVEVKVDRLARLIDGDSGDDIPGLRPTVREVRQMVAEMKAERDALVNQLRGAQIALRLLGITNIATLLAVALQIAGVLRP